MEKMTNEEKKEKYKNKKVTITSIGIGAMIGNAGFGIWDNAVNNFDCATPVILVGVTAAIVTGCTLLKKSPYVEIAKEKKKEKNKTKN